MENMNDSAEYYRMREAREREAAEKAAIESIRQIHLALADKYSDLAEKAENRTYTIG